MLMLFGLVDGFDFSSQGMSMDMSCCFAGGSEVGFVMSTGSGVA